MDLGNSIVELDLIHIISETRLEKLYYCRRDSAKHVVSIAFMDPYAAPELYSERFNYKRKAKAYGHAVTVWLSAMVVAAPADENFDIGANAEMPRSVLDFHFQHDYGLCS